MSNIAPIQPEQNVTTQSMVFDPQIVAGMQRLAETMATAKVTLPKHLAGSPGDCLAIIMQAAQWRMNPFAVAQKTHLVNGALGYEAQLVNAVVAASGAIRGRFHYEYRGENGALECRVGATPTGEREVQWGEWLSLASVKVKNSPLWATNPKQQLGYLQVKNWARQYAPGAILGVYTADELEREVEGERVATGLDRLQAAMGAPPETVALDKALTEIAACQTLEALQAGELVGKLGLFKGVDRKRVAKAYKDREQALRPPPEVDLDTGEYAPDLSEVLDLIREAGPEDAEDVAAVIGKLPEKDKKVAEKAWADKPKPGAPG